MVNSFQCVTATTLQNNICWMVIQHLTKESSKQNDSFRNSEWGPEAADAMCKEIRHFPIPGGKDGNLTMGDLIDRCRRNLISKVMLEEKVFSTWHGGRTVLLGDGETTSFHSFFSIVDHVRILEQEN